MCIRLISTISKLNKIKNGKTVKISRSEIMKANINLYDISRDCSKEEFKIILQYYQNIEKDKEKEDYDFIKCEKTIQKTYDDILQIHNSFNKIYEVPI